VVARRGGDDPARAAVLAERGQLGRRAADLERSRPLEVLGLERDRAARAQRDRPRGQHGRPPRDRLHGGAGRGDVVGGDRGHQSGSASTMSISTSAPSGSAATPIVLRAGGSLSK
jgi:hypothetical protein